MLNEKGFSLIQAMVALTVVGTVSLGVASQLNHVNVTIRFIQRNAKLDMLAYEMQSLLYSPTRCETALQGKTLDVANSEEVLGDAATFQSIDIANNAAIDQINANASNNIQINDLSIKVVGDSGAGDGTVKAVAKVSGAKVVDGATEKLNIKDQEFEIILRADAGNIDTCQSVGLDGVSVGGAAADVVDPADDPDIGAMVTSLGEDYFVNNTAPTLVDGVPRTSCPEDFILHGIAENGGFMCKPVRVHLRAQDMANINFYRGGAATIASANVGIMASIKTDATLTDVKVNDLGDIYTTSVILNSIKAGIMANVTATGESDVLIEDVHASTWSRVRIKNEAP